MQGIFAARCQAWTRFIFVFALSLLVVPTAFAQGAAGAATGGSTPAANDTPAPTEPSAPAVDADLPSEPPPGATLPSGEAELARGLPLQKIEVLGNRRVTAADVLTYVRERVGQPFKPETLTQDVRELWNSGLFDDIEVKNALAAEKGLREFLKSKHAAFVERVESTKDLTKDDEAALTAAIQDFKKTGGY